MMRHNQIARFWGLGVLLSLVPVAAVGPENRVLFFVGVGSMGLLAQLVQMAFTTANTAQVSAAWRMCARAAVFVLQSTCSPRPSSHWKASHVRRKPALRC